MNGKQVNREFFKALPKVELHRHLEGSLRLQTLLELARSQELVGLPGTDRLRTLVQVNEEEPYTFQNFLSKFQTLRLFYRSPEIIGRIAREAVVDAAQDNIRYMELRFTPVALSRAEGFSFSEVMDWVIEGVREAEHEHDIEVGLIASVNRHEEVQLAEQVVALAADRQSKGIAGIDLSGNEALFSALPFAGLFQEARRAGLHITAHGGEWSGAESVRDAIEHLGAERIGHGVRIMEDPAVVALAREREAVFEVSLTSNYQSGSIQNLSAHPLAAMYEAGLRVTLNTDDPSICRVALSDEFYSAYQDLGISLQALRQMIFNAAGGAFLIPAKRQALYENLAAEISQFSQASPTP